MDQQRLARGLGWFSIGLGLIEMVAPRQIARGLGLPGQQGLIRVYGLREFVSGLGILSGKNTGGWIWARVGGDALDLAVLGQALAQDNPRRDAAMVATAAVAGVTLLDVVCGLQVQQDIDTSGGVLHLEKSITIDRSPDDLYAYWRDFENLPNIMRHLVSVRADPAGRSHWVARAPLGRTLEWDAEISLDRPGQLIAWHSLPGSDVDHMGSVGFNPAPGGRGTVVRVEMTYTPPAGRIGATLVKLFGEGPEQQVAVDLQHFKQWMETGEIARIEGQSAGRPQSISKYEHFLHH